MYHDYTFCSSHKGLPWELETFAHPAPAKVVLLRKRKCKGSVPTFIGACSVARHSRTVDSPSILPYGLSSTDPDEAASLI